MKNQEPHTAKIEPVKVGFKIPEVTAKSKWENEIAIALIGILLTLSLSIFSISLQITDSIHQSVMSAVVVSVSFVLSSKTKFFRHYVTKFVNWWVAN